MSIENTSDTYELDHTIKAMCAKKERLEAAITELIEVRARLISDGKGPKKRKKGTRSVMYVGLTDAVRNSLKGSRTGKTTKQVREDLLRNKFHGADEIHLRMRISTDIARLIKQGEVSKKKGKDGTMIYSLKV